MHWGADLGALSGPELAALADAAIPAVPPSSIDVPLRLSLLPTLAEGWSGRPGLSGFRRGVAGSAGSAGSIGSGRPADLALRLEAVQRRGARSLRIDTADAAASVSVSTDLELTVEGVLRVRHTLTNTGDTDFELGSLDMTLPVPDRAGELLDFTGLWSHERRPQRTRLAHGVWSRESRHGRPGHDDPFLSVAGVPGFGFRRGEVWAVHLAWSGDKRVWAERSALGAATLGSGELLAPGELALPAGAGYTSPWTVAAYSATGLDGLSARLHPWIRSWATIHDPRPVVLNTWEAVYFDHDLPTLTRLVEAAARAGVERFVLDDGWFTGRTDDKRALGDWFVDPVTWPGGLHPLVERVHAAGLSFGLWVEPEMVSLDSELARAHPDWVLGAAGSLEWRFQRVLDLGNPDAFAYVLARLTALLDQYPIAYLKWDHNRDLLGGSAHRQTEAVYRLLGTLRAAHPGLEIESCASGGARIDLGILPLVDRVWTSDTNDPLERQQIQRYTGVLVPPEYLGGHLGAATAHTTGRTASLGFRLATALFGSAGIEWDLTRASAGELEAVAGWIAEYKRLRPLLHSGVVVHADASDPALELHGVVAGDGASAVFAYVALAAPRTALPASLRFPGLDPDARYTVRPLTIGGAVDPGAEPSGAGESGVPTIEPRVIQDAAPAWLQHGSETLSGTVLAEVGLPAPLLAPEQAALFELTRL
ncbi:alpha-galactosidase [Cryobacterium sp. RTC2.1]|uniref:alpha-galactosidase n=1 Tax=Cryobacterium sp. RTC2.1 TaxID=3048634 RepID=UPI002B229D80|nr:alpha-galactosidase [Cryobacterium sp. RTC2.1]MEB0004964.1 alpha-galactosidase [Cryobacterium sp. RTC2.1]